MSLLFFFFVDVINLQFTIHRYAGTAFYGGPMTAYSNPYAEGFEPYAGYHDPALHSAIPSYAYDHDHHPHHAIDYGHYMPDHTRTREGMMNDDGDPKESDMGGGGGSVPVMQTYRRVGRHRRRRANKQQPFK